MVLSENETAISVINLHFSCFGFPSCHHRNNIDPPDGRWKDRALRTELSKFKSHCKCYQEGSNCLQKKSHFVDPESFEKNRYIPAVALGFTNYMNGETNRNKTKQLGS